MIQRRAALVLVATALLMAGCGPKAEFFLQRAHRTDFALSLEELKSAQFYISNEVLAHEIGTPAEGTERGVYVVDRDTPGAVTAGGPDWLRVSFGSSSGAPFIALTDDTGADSWYWLATEVDGKEGFVRVRDEADKYVVVDGRKFRLAYGDEARLLIDKKDLERLMQRRARAPGRGPGQ